MKKSKLFKGYVQEGQPQFKKGYKVIAPGFTEDRLNDELIIKSSFWNGFTWMYYFEDSEMGLGEMYLEIKTEKEPV